jgi:hypothetical protein
LWEQGRMLIPPTKSKKVLRILIAHQLSRETQPSKPLPILKN